MTTKTEGHVTWATLATYSDEAAIAYFMTVKGQTEKYARNSLRFLRDKYGRPEASTQATTAPAVPHTPALPTPATARPEASQTTTKEHATMTTAIQTTDGGLAVLASMLVPHLFEPLQGHVNAAIEKVAMAAKAPVVHVHLPKAPEPVEIKGAHSMLPKVLRLATTPMASGKLQNVFLKGPMGCGKTSMAKAIGKALNRRVVVISCSAGMSEGQLLGRLLPIGANGAFRYVESPFMKAYRNGYVILLDEVDGADANLLLAINAALENGGIEIAERAANDDGETYVERHPDTVILSAANTWGTGADTVYVGRAALDGAFMDRFYPVEVGYDHAIESTLASPEIVARVHTIRALAERAKLRRGVSTRMIQKLDAAVRAGLTIDEALNDLLAAWTRDERQKVAA